MKKFFSLFAAVLFAGSMMAADVTDVLNRELTGQSGTTYAAWSGKTATSDAVYAGQSAGGNDAIQLRSNNSNSGIVTTASGGTLKSITVTFNSNTAAGRTVDVYASNSAYTQATDLYGDNKGTKVASLTASATSYTFTDEYQFIGIRSNSGALYLDKVEIVWTVGGDPTPVVEYYVVGTMNNWTPAAAYKLAANPGQAGEYMGEFTFAANDEIKVRRTTDGEADAWFPEGMGNNYVINEAGDYTVYFRPEGNTEWGNGFFDAVKKEPAQPITCAEVYNLAKNDNVELLNDVVVTFANGKNVWVKDETASMLIYFSANTTYAAGDVLSGIAGVVDVYNGIHEVKPSADQAAAIVATAGEAPAAEAVTAVVAADVNKYIVMKGVEAEGTFAEGAQSNITINNVTVRNQFKNGYVFEAGNHYDVYGVVTLYQSNPQVYFITAVEVDPTAIDNTNIDAKAVKFFENGQLIIIKNGVRYNAQGAVVR